MAIPILKTWRTYFEESPHEGLGSSYERVVLNSRLELLQKRYGVSTCLEVPIFGFTGLSGINSLCLARSGVRVTLVDDHQERLCLIKGVWQEAGEKFNGVYAKDFTSLPFADKSFDLSWNFSALWFVSDIQAFLQELARVTQKVIFFGVPNRWGLGFFLDKYVSAPELQGELKEQNISPRTLTKNMGSLGWHLVERGYIDVPPWPDIGMKKEDFLKVFGLRFPMRHGTKKVDTSLTIMNYYKGVDPNFPARMWRYYWFEKRMPNILKTFWAHHRFLTFEPSGVSAIANR